MSDDSFTKSEEKQFIGDIVKNQTKYGSIRTNPFKGSRFITHRLQNNDTLQGLSLRYNVTMEMIKRANNLWTTDSLFSRSTLKIPLDFPIMGINQCTNNSTNGTDNLDCEYIDLDEPPNGLEKENCFETSRDLGNFISDPEESLADFLVRIDSHIAFSKHRVDMQTKSKITNTYSDDDIFRKKDKSSTSYLKRHNSARTDIIFTRSHTSKEPSQALVMTQGRKVISSLKRLEQQQDELFEL